MMTTKLHIANYFKMFLCLLAIFCVVNVYGQLSEGGQPLDISTLKTKALSVNAKVVMPEFDTVVTQSYTEEELLMKTVKFAHSFDVDLTTENSGTWYDAGAYKIWQLEIESEGALGLGLIFSKYRLPEDARLFIFNEEKSVVYGAYTSRNNKLFNKLAIYPFPSDDIVVQFEVPVNSMNDFELELGRVNHDFLGVSNLKTNRWDQRESGSCNVNVDCETSINSADIKRSVMRIIADDELGTGTLINNTSEDGTPLVISAFHVFDKNENAEITLFDFNYESPFCVDVDGFDCQSISGATALASSASIDFMLVELSETPPAVFRPYYAGWNATGEVPSKAFTIHHPNGDVKKITYDEGVCDSMTFSDSFVTMSHWRIENWESGTTEGGSSGAGLFCGSGQQLFGTLTGGKASCTNLAYDAFARFDKMWDTNESIYASLYTWLDPENVGSKEMVGFDLYGDEDFKCGMYTNFQIDDDIALIDTVIGFDSFSEIAEKFSSFQSAVLGGVAVGIKDIQLNSIVPQLLVTIYTGEDYPVKIEQQYQYDLSGITSNAMNYFEFGSDVKVDGTFFIGVKVLYSEDAISVFQSDLRNVAKYNTLMIYDGADWNSVSEYNSEEKGASCLMQINACNVTLKSDAVDSVSKNELVKAYPNPIDDYLIVEFSDFNETYEITISDMVGKIMFSNCYENHNYAEIDVSSFRPGIYVLNVSSGVMSDRERIIVY